MRVQTTMGMRLTILNKIIVVLIIIASVVWTYVAYSRGMIDPQLTVTLIVVEVPSELGLAWLISKVLERPEELARKFAEEKQKLEEIDRDRRAIYDAIQRVGFQQVGAVWFGVVAGRRC